jgi:hypothetical protein
MKQTGRKETKENGEIHIAEEGTFLFGVVIL